MLLQQPTVTKETEKERNGQRRSIENDQIKRKQRGEGKRETREGIKSERERERM